MSNWESFRFDEIFIIKGGFYNKRPKFSSDAQIPFIGATNTNNGVTGFCTFEDIENSSKTGSGKNHELKYKLFPGNCITVTNNGSVGHAYYQVNQFTCSHDINILYLKDYVLNKYLAMFLISLIEQQGVCFAYSRKWRPMRMKSSNILLPVNDEDEPDYILMEDWAKKEYVKKINRILELISNKLNSLIYNKILSLDEVCWDSFFIESIGTIKSGKDITKKNMVPGDTPYISSTALNNGVSAYIDNTNNTLEKDCISINRNGSVGYAFYHPYYALFSNDCRKLITDLDKYCNLFIVNQIKAQKDKYNYGYKMGTNRIKRQQILLPVTDDGEPDYDYMRQYMINVEISMLQKYLKYIGK